MTTSTLPVSLYRNPAATTIMSFRRMRVVVLLGRLLGIFFVVGSHQWGMCFLLLGTMACPVGTGVGHDALMREDPEDPPTSVMQK